MLTREYEGILFDSGQELPVNDFIAVEEALQIVVNGKPFSITMRTPGDDEYLIRGLLHTENIIASPTLNPSIKRIEDQEEICTYAVELKENELGHGYTNSRSLLSVASCGICGKTELDQLEGIDKLISSFTISPNSIADLFMQLNKSQEAFRQSGGSHAAAAFDENNILLASYEDVGRHNAVDKVIGALLINNKYRQAKTLAVSGRISYEIVVKCFKAGIPVLASVSAPSTLAVDFAKELGITLFSFCRGNRATCYANLYRVERNKNMTTI